MFVLDGSVVTSPSDLTLASSCEYAFARALDRRLGKDVVLAPEPDDPIQRRAAELGDAHESVHLDRFRAHHPGEVVVLDRPAATLDALRAAQATTREALLAGAAVVAQAVFFDEETDPDTALVGYADFLVRQPDGRYRVIDTKLARRAKVTALLQLAAYHEQLVRLGVPVDDTVELLLGTDEPSRHEIADIAPVYRRRRARLLEIVRQRVADPAPVRWGDERYVIDGRCAQCEPEVEAHRDLLLVAGIRSGQRQALLEAGVTTIDQLAGVAHRPPALEMPARTFEALREQAIVQVGASPGPHAAPPYRLIDDGAEVARIPAPDPGDIFFDFEGDPLYAERRAGAPEWNLDYLFGFVDRDDDYTCYWAHDFDDERAALVDFLEDVRLRLIAHPGMHIYHYASYERTHLLTLTARHRHGEEFVAELLRRGVLVDLYPVVRRAVRVGSRSYSIKKLEPLYMGEDYRPDDAAVSTAGGSVEQYHLFQAARDARDERAARELLDGIADYNRYDCISTRRLLDWLGSVASARGNAPGTVEDELPEISFEADPLADDLVALARTAEAAGDLVGADAFALAAAAVDFHRRESRSTWWEHFHRLEYPDEEWADDRGVFAVVRGEVLSDWRMARTRSARRIRLVGRWSPGSSYPREPFALYPRPWPYEPTGASRHLYAPTDTREAEFIELRDDPELDEVVLTESAPGEAGWSTLPAFLVPGRPIDTRKVQEAIRSVADRLVTTGPGRSALDDILWRQPARTRRGALEAARDAGDLVRAVTASVRDLDSSYLAVQGPPGTGKTYLAAHVIRDLVREHGWRVGIVAQSHKVVENVLSGVVRAGLPSALVGKATDDGANAEYTVLDKNAKGVIGHGYAGFAARNEAGYVIGGTMWDFANTDRVARGQLDLLVIDEAGQFSLAATAAVSVAARNLLLLGDPQQLPQVSQGTHPAPVDQSALGYIAGDHAVLPAEYGYFLPLSWRMHPAVSQTVSWLSYDGQLHSAPAAAARHLDADEPGLHVVPVEHAGNATHSSEEGRHVVGLVRDHLGRRWTDGGTERALTERDIIVVTPYNAQVETIRLLLDASGLSGVRVGTVDKFQGQEAVISIVSLAASSAEDVPRGIDFLLNRNRLNVAISRAQWAAYVVFSPGLTQFLPHTPEGVAELSRFLRLVET